MAHVPDLHLAEIPDLCRRYGVARLEVFGSAVTDAFDLARSDIDFLIEFDDNRRIAWQHSGTGAIGSVVGPGAIWRFELEPADGGTLVHETWDFSAVRGIKPLLRLARARNDTRAGMEKTLERIETILAGS